MSTSLHTSAFAQGPTRDAGHRPQIGHFRNFDAGRLCDECRDTLFKVLNRQSPHDAIESSDVRGLIDKTLETAAEAALDTFRVIWTRERIGK